jgi:hypothetical protein
MKNRALLVVSAASVAGLAVGAGGCFGSDPNKNSMTLSGTAGTSGSGNGGAGGSVVNPNGPIVGQALATFDSTVEGFMLNNYHDTGQTNLGDPASGASPAPKVSVDAVEGNPTPGSLKVTAPYSGANQYVDLQKSFGTAMPQDWSGGRTMHVRVKVTEGTFGGGLQAYAITTSGYVFGGTFTNVAKGTAWQEFRLDIDHPMTMNAGYDPTKVVVFGVQLNTGSAGASATPVTFNIDSFSIDPPLPGGGTGGSGGSGGAGGTSGDAATDSTGN